MFYGQQGESQGEGECQTEEGELEEENTTSKINLQPVTCDVARPFFLCSYNVLSLIYDENKDFKVKV